jgi:hypothetical protein
MKKREKEKNLKKLRKKFSFFLKKERHLRKQSVGVTRELATCDWEAEAGREGTCVGCWWRHWSVVG